MKLGLGAEQVLLQDSFRRFFGQEASPAVVRAAEVTGFDAALWAKLADLGTLTLRRPGAAALFDAIICAEEAGRALAPGPIVEAMVAVGLLDRIGRTDLADAIADGTTVATIALHDAAGAPTQIVPGGAAATLVLARHGDAVLLVREGRGARAPDLGSGAVAGWTIDRAGAELLGEGQAAIAAWTAAHEEWRLLTAATTIGAAARALELAADYAKERVQFGRPIGSFQGVAHPLATSFTDVEGARLLLWRAVWAAASGSAEAGGMVALAFWFAATAAERAVARALHSFGGYGLSLEYDIQLYHRRALAWPLIAGDPRDALLLAADRLWNGGNTTLPDVGELPIDFGLGEAAARFAERADTFFAAALTDELRAHAHHSWEGHHPGFQRQLAAAGMLFPDVPEAHGGEGRNAYEMTALAEVFDRHGWTRHAIAVASMVVQTVLAFGSEALKAEVLPRLLSGEAIASFGFSEPAAGSDVFAARTRAVRDGDGWLINGQKMFTSGADIAQYVLLLTRTDPDAGKHRGLTIFLVPLETPGIEVQAVHTLSDERTNITFYTDVRIDDRYRIGEIDAGAAVMAAALTMEQGATDYHLRQFAMLAAALEWARMPAGSSDAPFARETVRERLARTAAHAYIAECLSRRALWATAEGQASRWFGPMAKLFATEAYITDSTDLLRLAAPQSLLRDTAAGRLELDYRHATATTIYGGTSEIMRSLIAETGLGLPRARS